MRTKKHKIIRHEWNGLLALGGILLMISSLIHHSHHHYWPKAKHSEWLEKVDSIINEWNADTIPELNTCTAYDLIDKGVDSKISYRVINYRDKYGTFNSWSQLENVYGMNDSLLGLIRHLCTIDSTLADTQSIATTVNFHFRKTGQEKKQMKILNPKLDLATTQKSRKKIDINTADSLTLVSIRGIGPVFSSRILKFRDRLGGFCEVAQIKETYGLPPETFEILTNELIVRTPCQKINPNLDSLDQLAAHLYIPDWMAEKIIRLRERDSLYSDLDNFKKRTNYKDEYLTRIRPYLIFNLQ